MTGRARLAAICVAVALLCGVAGCRGSSGGGTSAPGISPDARSTVSQASGARPTATASPTPSAPCSNLGMIGTWPLPRRAAAVIVAPVLNFDMAAVRVAAARGAGGILYLGGAAPPPGLAGQVTSTVAGTGTRLAPLVMADEEGGGVQRLTGAVASLPWPRDMAETLSAGQVRDLAASTATQMLRLGVTVDLAPVLDVDGGAGPNAVDADGRRSFSADPAVAARYGVAFLQGLAANGVLPVVKHFPGLGGASRNTDYGPATTLPLATLNTSGLQPFRAALAAGAPAVMMSNAAVPGLTTLPASLSAAAVDELRTTLGFQGLVITDSLSAGAISQSGYDLPRAGVAAIAAGNDMILFGSTLTPAQTLLLTPQNVATSIGQIADAIVAAVGSGTLAASRLNNAVEHVLAAGHINLCA